MNRHLGCLTAFVLLLQLQDAVSAEPMPLRQVIDLELQKGWKSQSLSPAAPASDAAFLRRVTLDLIGRIPTVDEANAFLESKDDLRREKLVDKLLADPRFAQHQAEVWELVLNGRNPGYEFRNRTAFKEWLTRQIEQNVGMDSIAEKILLAEEPGSELYLARFRNRPEDAAVDVARVFLGTQIQCARCHDHPFDHWTQKDFYGLAGFFVRLVVTESGDGNNRRFVVSEKSRGEVLFSGAAKDQAPGKKGEPVKARFLGAEQDLAEPELPKDFQEPKLSGPLPKPRFSRKTALAKWIADPKNPYFARAISNRIWGQFLGRGLSHPVDDLGDHNAPSHPELLDQLVKTFQAGQFSLRPFLREIVLSESYQLASTGKVTEANPKQFERARVRPLSAEEILASLKMIGGYKPEDKVPNVTTEYFFRYFGEPMNGIGDFQAGLGEQLFLNNSGDLRTLLARRKGNIADLLATSSEPWEKRIEQLFLTVLSRRPSATETARFVEHFQTPGIKPDTLITEALWVLVNTSEFRFNK